VDFNLHLLSDARVITNGGRDEELNGWGQYRENFHVMFIDESRLEKKKYTCVMGLIVPAERVIPICERIDKFVMSYLGKDYSFFDGSINLKWLRRTRHEESPFGRLSQRRQLNFLKRVYGTLHYHGCTLVCCIVEELKDYQSAIKNGLYFILERFFYFLRENDSSGIVISDQPASGSYDYKKELVELVRSREFWGKRFHERIYQDIFFTRDEWDPLVQIADLVTSTFSSYVKNCLKSKSLSELSEKYDFRYRLWKNISFKTILPMIRKGYDERVLGYGVKCI